MRCLHVPEIMIRQSSSDGLIHKIINHIQKIRDKIRDLTGNKMEAKFSLLTLRKKALSYMALFLLFILICPALEINFTIHILKIILTTPATRVNTSSHEA